MVMPGLAARGLRKGVRAGAGAVRRRIQKGKSVSAAPAGAARPRRRRRSRTMYMRKGRLMMGFTQKEVKAAMQRRYGGRRSKK